MKVMLAVGTALRRGPRQPSALLPHRAWPPLALLVRPQEYDRSINSRRFLTSSSPSSSSSSGPSKPPATHGSRQEEDEEREAITAEVIRKKLAADVELAKELALHQVVNVPNVITFARILATPYLGLLIWNGDYAPAIGVLAVAGLSDWLDGYIARRFKQESIVGSFLDPFADKLLVGTLSLSMLASGLVPWPVATLVFGRDVLLVSGTLYHRLTTKAAGSAFFDTSDSGAFQVAPSLLSKVNTGLQFSMFGLALTNAVVQLPGDPAMDLIFGIVGTTTFLSGSEYLWSYVNKTGAFRPLPLPTKLKEKQR